MYLVEQVGGLAVAFSPVDQKAIERELKALDPNLFLDFETNGRFVYPVVMEWIGERFSPPAIPIVVWKDRDGPRPLSFALVEQVKRQGRERARARAEGDLVKRIAEANEEMQRRADADRDEHYDDITLDFERAARNGGHFSGPVPRSRKLYLSRARARRKGKAR